MSPPGDVIARERELGYVAALPAQLEAGPAALVFAGEPIESARTFLVAGQIERRQRRKTVAAGHLRRAQEAFGQMGAALWAERARTELARVGLPRSAPAQLTPSEQRVAELAAAGRTNREVAARLFMSPKTVEANLARIYRKLGVHSRAGLGAQLATARFTGSPPSRT